MQVGGDIAAVLFMPVYGQNFQRIDVPENRAELDQAAFLPDLPHGNG